MADDFRLVYEKKGYERNRAHPKQWVLVRDRSRIPLKIPSRRLALPAMEVKEMILSSDKDKIRYLCSVYSGTIWQSDDTRQYLAFGKNTIRVFTPCKGEK